ncbi:MAG: O-antigen biosynthesis protein, partial [Acidimicrobiales bacterium]
PALRWPGDPEPAALIEAPLRRSFPTVRQVTDPDESLAYAERLGATRATAEAVAATHAAHREPALPRTVNWFVPDLDSPFYGGINTALRLADLLAREHGVEPRFVVWGRGPEAFIRSALAAAFPALAGADIVLHDGSIGPSLAALPAADAAIATLWGTAYLVAHFPHAARKFYLVQDFEPEFHPAGTMFALAEETYRLGLYGLCNSEPLRRLYEGYGGRAAHFVPAVDPLLFHAKGRTERPEGEPVTVFAYARSGHWRNCWELASVGLRRLKDRLGDKVRIVAAGSWALPPGGQLDGVAHHLGLLDYRGTAALYRRCDVGLALTVSRHPSYLPLELMACGVPVVAFDSPSFGWL